MKLSCTQMMLGERPLAEAFAMATACGFDGIDLRGDMIVDRTDEIRALVERTGLLVPAVYGRITIPLLARTIDERRSSLDLVRRRLRDAAAVGASDLIVVPIFGEARIRVGDEADVAAIERALLLVLLDELADEAERSGVRIVIEPLNHRETHLLTSPTTAAGLTSRLGSPWVGTMVDTYHMDIEGQDAAAEIERIRDQLLLVHLSDRGRTLPGEGGIDFAPALRALASIGYDGYMGFECAGPFDVEQLRRSVEWVREQAGTTDA